MRFSLFVRGVLVLLISKDMFGYFWLHAPSSLNTTQILKCVWVKWNYGNHKWKYNGYHSEPRWKRTGSVEEKEGKRSSFSWDLRACASVYVAWDLIYFNIKGNKGKPKPRWCGDISTFFQRSVLYCGSIFMKTLRDDSDAERNI